VAALTISGVLEVTMSAVDGFWQLAVEQEGKIADLLTSL
jgi:hypothetical protein